MSKGRIAAELNTRSSAAAQAKIEAIERRQTELAAQEKANTQSTDSE